MPATTVVARPPPPYSFPGAGLAKPWTGPAARPAVVHLQKAREKGRERISTTEFPIGMSWGIIGKRAPRNTAPVFLESPRAMNRQAPPGHALRARLCHA